MPITISNPRLRLTIDPALGAGIADFSIAGPAKGWYPLMRRAAPGESNPSNLACFTMAPYSNRLRDARFTFDGRTHQLRPTSAPGVTPVVAQHGDVRARPWSILDRSPLSARLAFTSRDHDGVNFPFAFSSIIRYELRDDRLLIDLSVTNDDAHAMPAGCGLHPYFPRALFRHDDAVTVRVPCAHEYPLSNGLPTGAPALSPLVEHFKAARPLPSAPVDTVLGGFSGVAQIEWPQSGVTLTMRTSPNLGHVVLFAPHTGAQGGGPLPYLAVEPVTNVNDGFNLHAQGAPGTGVQVLAPGESLQVCYAFELSERA